MFTIIQTSEIKVGTRLESNQVSCCVKCPPHGTYLFYIYCKAFMLQETFFLSFFFVFLLLFFFLIFDPFLWLHLFLLFFFLSFFLKNIWFYVSTNIRQAHSITEVCLHGPNHTKTTCVAFKNIHQHHFAFLGCCNSTLTTELFVQVEVCF